MRALGALLGFVVLVPAGAQGQQIAVNGGIGVSLFLPTTTYTSRYAPPFPATPHTGTAIQQLQLDPAKRPLFWGGIEWFPHAHAGLTIRGTFRRSPLTGANEPYHVAVDYSARQPPDSVERQYQYTRDAVWPDTTGRLTTFAIDALAAFASDAAKPARIRVGAGVSVIGLSGSFQPLGVTAFLLGGHGVLFTNEYQAVLDIPRTWAVAGVTSAQLAFALGTHAALDVGLRVVLPRTAAVAPRVVAVIPVTAVQTLTVAEAERALVPAPLGLRLASADVLIGLRIRN